MRKIKISELAAKRMNETAGNAAETKKKEHKPRVTAGKHADRIKPALQVISRTDTGLCRKSNQDALILGENLVGIADGMGGHNGGETASAGVRDGLLRELKNAAPSIELLEKAVRTVNRELWDMQDRDDSLAGMGTTLTVLWTAGREMLLAHVGDSRAYLLRNGEFKRITADHSMVAEMVRRGMLTEEQAACHPMRNYITRAVGTDKEIETDLISIPREKGDRWLVCSDGLHGLVPQNELERLTASDNPEEAADQMVRLALDAGGRDNISLILVLDDGPQNGPDTDRAEQPADGETEAAK